MLSHPRPFLLGFMSVTLLSCSMQKVDLDTTTIYLNESTSQKRDKPALSRQTRQKIGQLLYRAEIAFNRGRLTEPFDDNAYFHYLNILALDEHNRSALDGLNNIVESYLGMSLDHLNRMELKYARDFLMKAKSIDPAHPNILAVEHQLNQQGAMRAKRYPLSLSALHKRSPALVKKLREIGKLLSQDQAYGLILAPSDAACRWIYQQLNSAEEKGVSADFRYEDRAEVLIFYP